ncbi:uncharacterized protein [Heterodontus francisci]|uniref:uncharacterized protein n=1 Tax=Heterodontus francisci TaxID=7792 RepID=UPI00355B2C2B
MQLYGSYVSHVLKLIVDFQEEEEQHKQLLGELLGLLEEAGLKVNLRKAQIGQEKVQFLGLILSSGEKGIDAAKQQAVQDLPLLMNAHGLGSFFGLTGYCREFIEDYATVTKSLQVLLRKGVDWKLEEEHQKAFKETKRCLQTASTLGTVDPSLPFQLKSQHLTPALALCCCKNGMGN